MMVGKMIILRFHVNLSGSHLDNRVAGGAESSLFFLKELEGEEFWGPNTIGI